MAVRVTINQGELQRFLRSPEGPVGKTLLRTGQKVAARAQYHLSGRMAQRRTGKLANSIQAVLERGGPSGLKCVVGTNIEYALPLHAGHGVIRPVRAQALRFIVDGQPVFAKSVRATKPRPFLTQSLREVVG